MSEDARLQEYEMVQRQLQAIDRQMGNIEAQLQDANRAKLTLAALQEGSEVLLPIGAGIHVPAIAGSLDQLVIPIGGDYLAQGTVAQAIEKLDGHMQQLQAAQSELRKGAQELMERA